MFRSNPFARCWIPGLVALGIVLRLAEFFHDRSLWLDEAMLALELIRHSCTELAHPLQNNQIAPIGYLLLVKAITLSWNDSEQSLRFVSLLAGIGALVAFVPISRQWLEGTRRILAIGLFSLADPLVYFSNEAKPYSLDVFIAVLVLGIAARPLPNTLQQRITIALGGMAAVLLSFPAIFSLLSLTTLWAIHSTPASRFRLLGPVACWLAVFFWQLKALTPEAPTVAYLKEYWASGFIPWNTNAFFQIPVLFTLNFRDIFGFAPSALPTLVVVPCLIIALSLWGLSFWNIFHSQSLYWLPLLGPCILVLLAALFHRYPFADRLVLFLAPSTFLLIARAFPGQSWASLAIAILLIPGLWMGTLHLASPRDREELRGALVTIQPYVQPGDVFYVYYTGTPTFQYYASRLRLSTYPEILGQRPRSDRMRLDAAEVTRHPRVWLVFSQSNSITAMNTGQEELLQAVAARGICRRMANQTDASVWLGQFTPR